MPKLTYEVVQKCFKNNECKLLSNTYENSKKN